MKKLLGIVVLTCSFLVAFPKTSESRVIGLCIFPGEGHWRANLQKYYSIQNVIDSGDVQRLMCHRVVEASLSPNLYNKIDKYLSKQGWIYRDDLDNILSRSNEKVSWINLSVEEIVGKPKKEKPKKKKPPSDDKIVAAASGSGFFVSNSGDIITNHHVIEGCNVVKVNFKGSGIEAKTIAIDKVNDIAILKAKIKPDKVYSVSNEDVSLLEDVIVAGYPLGKKVSSAIKTHKGVVTSLAGAGDNYSNFQTDATINQGNSGGPIMNQKGNIVGIAVATWVEEGVQGVHFGIKSSTLKTFASANGLRFLPPNNRDLSNKQLGQLITSGTVYLECHMTIAKIKKMIAEANNRKAFFSEYR